MSHTKRRLKPRPRHTLNLMGLVICKSPLIERNGNKMFLFELSWSCGQKFIIAKGNQWQLYKDAQVHKYIFLSNVISTTITKGLDEQIKVYACTSKTKISVKDERQLRSLEKDQNGERTIHLPVMCQVIEHVPVTSQVIEHAPVTSQVIEHVPVTSQVIEHVPVMSQVIEQSNKHPQIIYHQEQSNKHSPTSYQGKVTKVIDSNAGIYELDDNIRLYLTYLNKDIGCVVPEIKTGCFVTIYNAHFKTILKVPHLVCCMRSHVEVLPVTSHSSYISLDGCLVKLTTQFIPGLFMLTCLQALIKQLELKLPEKFHRKISKMIGNMMETDIELPLLPRERNIYAEFLRSPHQSCVVDDLQAQSLFTLPSIAELKKEIVHQFTNSNTPCGKKYKHYVSLSTTSNNPRILVAFLSSNAATGSLSLHDETGSIECLATSLQPDQFPSHICKNNTTCFQRRDQPLHAPYSYACPYAHVWNLNGLVKLTQFLMVHEQFSQEQDFCESDTMRVRSYIVFDMRQAVYVTSHQPLPASPVSNPAKETTSATQSHICTIKVIKKGNLIKRLRKTDSSMSFTIDAVFGPDIADTCISTILHDAGAPSSVTLDKINHAGPTNVCKKRTNPNIVLRFEGTSVKWYPVLYIGCCYKIIKHQYTDDNWKALEKLSNHSTLTVNEHDVIHQYLCNSSDQEFNDSNEVHSVQAIISRFKFSKKVVSFTGVVAACDTYKAHQPRHQDSVYMHLKVVDTKTSSCNDAIESLPIFIQCPIYQYPCGILPQALICVRGVEVDSSKGRIHCQSGPLTSVQILHIPSTVIESNVPDKQKQPSEAPTKYSIHILRSLLSGIKENNVTIHGYITALYSLEIRWICFVCKSHDQCTCCSSDAHVKGCMSFKARLLVEDGTTVVHVWCTDSQSIASILGLTDRRWQQILDVIKTDGPFHFNLFNDVNDKSNIMNLLKQLCKSSMIHHPVQLHCSSAYLRSTDEKSCSEQLWVQATVNRHGYRP